MTDILTETRAVTKQTAQRLAIMRALERDGTISVTAAWEGVYGCKIRRLGARIHELRGEGYEIRTIEETNGETYYKLISVPRPQQATMNL